MISLRLGNQKQGAAVRSYLFHSFGACVCQALLCPLPASANCTYMLGWSHFAEPNRHMSTFLLPILICRSHVEHWVELLLQYGCSLFAVLWRSITSTVSFLFPSEWKTLAWKLFHRPSLLFQGKIVDISLYQWFHRHCAYLPIQVFMLRASWEQALLIGRLVARWVLP